MEIPVVIEPVAGDGFVAKSGEPISISASGASRDEAFRNLREAVQQRLSSGTTIAPLNIGDLGQDNPWVKFAGMFKDEPMFDDVRQIMTENRKVNEADADFL